MLRGGPVLQAMNTESQGKQRRQVARWWLTSAGTVLRPFQAHFIWSLGTAQGDSHLTGEKTEIQSNGRPGPPRRASQLALVCSALGLVLCPWDLTGARGSGHLEVHTGPPSLHL